MTGDIPSLYHVFMEFTGLEVFYKPEYQASFFGGGGDSRAGKYGLPDNRGLTTFPSNM